MSELDRSQNITRETAGGKIQIRFYHKYDRHVLNSKLDFTISMIATY